MNENHTDVLDPAESSFTCSNRPQGVTGHSGYLMLDQITFVLCQWLAGPQALIPQGLQADILDKRSEPFPEEPLQMESR